MEFRQLRYFVAVAEEGNIGNAARRLNVSQPPVSRQIQALEQELGVTLLNRTPKGVHLTAAGATFLEDARKILAQAARAVEQSRSADRGEIGRLDVAFFGSLIYRTVPVVLRAFQRAQPNSDITLMRMGKKSQIDALKDGRIHIGFGRYYSAEPGIRIEKLGDEAAFIAISADMRLNVGSELSLSDIEHLPLILFPGGGRPSFADLVVSAYRTAGIEPKVEHVAEDVTSGLALTALGAACCIVPASVAELHFPTLKFYPLSNDQLRPPINCVFREEGIPPVLEAFLKVLRDSSIRTQIVTKNV